MHIVKLIPRKVGDVLYPCKAEPREALGPGCPTDFPVESGGDIPVLRRGQLILQLRVAA